MWEQTAHMVRAAHSCDKTFPLREWTLPIIPYQDLDTNLRQQGVPLEEVAKAGNGLKREHLAAHHKVAESGMLQQ